MVTINLENLKDVTIKDDFKPVKLELVNVTGETIKILTTKENLEYIGEAIVNNMNTANLSKDDLQKTIQKIMDSHEAKDISVIELYYAFAELYKNLEMYDKYYEYMEKSLIKRGSYSG